MTKITAVIITHNESRNIARCLRSLKGVADEIIVIDDHSTDDTAAISMQEGATVHIKSWLGFGGQKNFGNQLAAHDYILSLDADEALDEELATSINREKHAGLKGLYSFTRLNNYYGKFLRHGTEYPDYKIRLFPKNIQWNESQVHETLILPEGARPQKIAGHLLHFTYARIAEHVAKANKYTSLLAEDYKARGKKGGLFRILFSPLAAFTQAYLFRKGFLDGRHGLVLAIMHAYGTFLKYIKLWELNNHLDERKGTDYTGDLHL
jgi:glycosyltransferase involved in cell wall biosynthesis